MIGYQGLLGEVYEENKEGSGDDKSFEEAGDKEVITPRKSPQKVEKQKSFAEDKEWGVNQRAIPKEE